LKIKERSSEQVSEDDLRAFAQLVVPNKTTLLQIVSVRHTVAQREPGVAKNFEDVKSGSKSHNNFKKKAYGGGYNNNRGGGDYNNSEYKRGDTNRRREGMGSEFNKDRRDDRRYNEHRGDNNEVDGGFKRRERDEMEEKLS